MHPRVQQLIDALNLQPHPEGGYFCEVSRSSQQVFSSSAGSDRAACTDIYFLLAAGQKSLWHRVLHDEIWHLYEGAPLRLLQMPADCSAMEEIVLNAEQCRFKHLVPGGCWQAAESLGEYTLVGCTVAPGFDFRDFGLLRNCPQKVGFVKETFPLLIPFV